MFKGYTEIGRKQFPEFIFGPSSHKNGANSAKGAVATDGETDQRGTISF